MPSSNANRTSRQRVAAHRRRLTERGLRQVQLTVVDVRSDGFKREAARQSQLVAAARDEDDVMDFIETATDWSA